MKYCGFYADIENVINTISQLHHIKPNRPEKMEDTETKTISLALYRYMCQNIVGSENHVKTLRQMNTVRDNMKSNHIDTSITSGSFGEGLELRGSDLDIMYVSKTMEVYENFKPACNTNVIYLSMETDDVKHGFTLLLAEQTNHQVLCESLEELDRKHYYSGALVKQRISAKTGTVLHGPCISDKGGRLDLAMCLHCTTWVSQASEWIKRSNNSWPSYTVKQSILKHGVLFVSVGVKGSPKMDIEWRISFSVGEKCLINTFTHTQFICYALLKILLKDVIATFTECKDLLCSYFLKTIIFWISEDLPQSIWKSENIIHCFMRCFRRLIYSVDYSVCLHYFIPENNMFENKIEGNAREILLEKLNTLNSMNSYGWQCILFSDQISNFHLSMWVNPIEPHTLHTIDVAIALKSNSLVRSNNMAIGVYKKDTCVYKNMVHQIGSCHQSSMKYVYKYYMSLWCSQFAQTIPMKSTKSSNKYQYNQYNSCLSTLLKNIHHDAVSGWLMLASFFYQTKQYSEALNIIMYSLLQCSPEKISRYVNISDMHYQLLKLKLFQNKSIVQLWKVMLLDHMKFSENSWLIPNELQIEVEN